MKHAFSLVELSIVLVILGLLVGGILSGQSLIRASEIRSVTNDYTRFRTAVFTFRDKYFAIPGDMSNATKFWGTQNATPSTCWITPSTTPATCDGDGDGTLLNAGNYVNHEDHRFWQHMANAGLIEGSYNGVGANNPTSQDGEKPGVTSPKLRIAGAAFQARWGGKLYGLTDMYDGDYGNILYFGIPPGQYNPHEPAVTTQEAWNIDVKIDDGRPALGILRTFKSGTTDAWALNSNQCSDSATQAVAQYNLSLGGIKCALVMIAGW